MQHANHLSYSVHKSICGFGSIQINTCTWRGWGLRTFYNISQVPMLPTLFMQLAPVISTAQAVEITGAVCCCCHFLDRSLCNKFCRHPVMHIHMVNIKDTITVQHNIYSFYLSSHRAQYSRSYKQSVYKPGLMSDTESNTFSSLPPSLTVQFRVIQSHSSCRLIVVPRPSSQLS